MEVTVVAPADAPVAPVLFVTAVWALLDPLTLCVPVLLNMRPILSMSKILLVKLALLFPGVWFDTCCDEDLKVISFLLVPVEAMLSFLDYLNLSELKKELVLLESITLPAVVFLRPPMRFIFIFWRLVPSK